MQCLGSGAQSFVLFSHHAHRRRMTLPIKTKHLIHLQALRDLVRNKDHRHRPLEGIDRSGEVFGRLLIEVGDGLVEDEDLRSLE